MTPVSLSPSDSLLKLDRQHLWHPYSNALPDNPLFAISSAKGCELTLVDGRILVDGMSSWWSTIHGYNHPVLNQAAKDQLEKMAHVMFGGLTHEPAVKLAQQLVELSPPGLNRVFLADSGSVSVEVALKMAQQYWLARKQPAKKHFLAFEAGYHGDTLGAMSVCDPHNGMHHVFADRIPKQFFAPKPAPEFDQPATDEDLTDVRLLLEQHHHRLAAVIIEPIVQGAGGMRFYNPDYLQKLRTLCDHFGVLLIADEIATGFGRTGCMFACEHAEISPDILTVGKALTGGYMTLAATLCTDEIADTISHSDAGVLMHGPTFMANPLACSVANASLQLLEEGHWRQQIQQIESQLQSDLIPLKNHPSVADARVLGAIGVIELQHAVNMKQIQPFIVEQGIWLRPFGRLLYTMPPFVIGKEQLEKITQGMRAVIDQLSP